MTVADEARVLQSCSRRVVREIAEHEVRAEERRARDEADRRSVAAPPVLLGARGDADAHGIENHIARELERMAFGLDEEAAVGVLEQVAAPAERLVEEPRVGAVQVLHRWP